MRVFIEMENRHFWVRTPNLILVLAVGTPDPKPTRPRKKTKPSKK